MILQACVAAGRVFHPKRMKKFFIYQFNPFFIINFFGENTEYEIAKVAVLKLCTQRIRRRKILNSLQIDLPGIIGIEGPCPIVAW